MRGHLLAATYRPFCKGGKIMSYSHHWFFLDCEINILKIYDSFHLAKVCNLTSSDIFVVDLNFISTESKQREPALSLAILGGTI